MFKDRLRSARKSKGYTQEMLAAHIGVKKSTVAGYESGNSEPDMDKIIAIMKALDVDANFLYQDEMASESGPVLSAEATEIALAFDSLSPEAKSLVRTVLDFATAHCITSPAPVTTSTAPVRSATPDPDIYPLKRIGTDAMTGLPFLGGIGGNDEILNIKNIASIERRELMEEMADEHCTTTELTEPD